MSDSASSTVLGLLPASHWEALGLRYISEGIVSFLNGQPPQKFASGFNYDETSFKLAMTWDDNALSCCEELMPLGNTLRRRVNH